MKQDKDSDLYIAYNKISKVALQYFAGYAVLPSNVICSSKEVISKILKHEKIDLPIIPKNELIEHTNFLEIKSLEEWKSM